ncbi:MAG: tetratricopeptide repeat protein [Clostridia bacterium]|nr:tetratricopeptide repeat protein [Clostridia bacterium]
MNRLDFSSIVAVIRYYISPDHGMNQGELLDELFYSLHADSKEPIIFDGASVNRWLKGTERVSPIISRYYLKKRNREKLAYDIEQYILPLMYDSDMAVQELYRLTVQDTTISDRKKNKLLKGYPCDTEHTSAQLIATLLCFSMERTFVRRTAANTGLMATGSLSPASADFILNNRTPAPCRHFCGREEELSVLHDLLNEHSKVFITGIPGIGKSEIAKAYAKQHKADYTNIVHLYYTGGLREDITRMDFVDDLPDDTDEVRYQRHARFLRTLKEDTLLIVDNFNATAAEDDLLAEVMAYRCKVLFTTRCRFDEYPMLELYEINDKQTLLHLMSNFYSEAAQHQGTLLQIIDAVHSHTLAVELAARLLETGMLAPHALLAKLQAEKAAFNVADTVSIHKDGHSTKATYYRHIHALFSLYQLAAADQDVMRSLCFTPATGISARLLAKWLQQDNLNTINSLIEMGFIQAQPGRIIALHPLVQEIALEELKPSVQNCRTLLDSLHEICLRHGEESPHVQVTMKTIEGIVTHAIKDDSAYYLRFVEDAIPFAEKYRCQRGVVALVHEMESLLADSILGTQDDLTLLLSYQALCANSPVAAIHLQEQALTLLTNITADNALLASNIHANLGGMYRESGNYIKAKEHMEAAISLMRQYDLLSCHDSIPQVVNYAMLLSEIGQPDKAIAVLEQIEKVVQEHNSDVCMDNAAIHEAMGNTYLMTGNMEQAAIQHRKCLAIYSALFPDQPDMLSAKQADLRMLYEQVGTYIAPSIPRIA